MDVSKEGEYSSRMDQLASIDSVGALDTPTTPIASVIDSNALVVAEEILGFTNDLTVFQMEIEQQNDAEDIANDNMPLYIPTEFLSAFGFPFLSNLDLERLMFFECYREMYLPFVSIGVESLNYFLKTFLALALKSEVITYALAAWGGFYLELRKPRSDFTRPTTYMQKAAKSICVQLGSMLQPKNKDDFFVLFSFYLIFIGIEVCTGDVRNWNGFMSQCSQLIRSYGGLGEVAKRFGNSNDIRWLISDFHYHDVLSSRAFCSGTTFQVADYAAAIPASVEYGIDPLHGLATPLYHILGEIANAKASLAKASLTVNEKFAEEDPMASELRSEFYENAISVHDLILVRIENCEPERVLVEMLKVDMEQHDLHVALFELIKMLCRMQLATSVMKMPPVSLQQQQMLFKSLALIDRLTPTKLKVALSFPLLVCGMNCYTDRDRALMTSRFRLQVNQYEIANLQRMEEIVEETWVANPTGQVCVDWTDVARDKGWNLYVG